MFFLHITSPLSQDVKRHLTLDRSTTLIVVLNVFFGNVFLGQVWIYERAYEIVFHDSQHSSLKCE